MGDNAHSPNNETPRIMADTNKLIRIGNVFYPYSFELFSIAV